MWIERLKDPSYEIEYLVYRPLNADALEALVGDLRGSISSEQRLALHNIVYLATAAETHVRTISDEGGKYAQHDDSDRRERLRTSILKSYRHFAQVLGNVEAATSSYLKGKYDEAGRV